MNSPVIAHVHITQESVRTEEITPPHEPRTETPIYRATHKRLVEDEDRPCFICGVRRSDLLDATRAADRTINPYAATAQESHHWPVERSLLGGVEPELVARDYPSVRQFKTFEEWVDSEANMLVLCSACHRTAPHAIHHTLWQDVIATKYARRDALGHRYQFAASAQDAPAALANDEQIERAAGIEQGVAQQVAAAPTTARLRAKVRAVRQRRQLRKAA